MSAPVETPRRPTTRDVTALIGMLAVLEAELLAAESADEQFPEWAQSLARRLVKDDLLSANAGRRELRSTLGDLNQRLRYVLGEHDDPDWAS